MKRCPKCKRQYDDETLRFCLEDGTPLFSAHDSDAPATQILPARAAPTVRPTGATIPSYPSGGELRPPESTEVRQSNPLLTGGVIAIAVLLLALVGIAAFFVLRQSNNQSGETDRNENLSGKNSSPTPRASPSARNTTGDNNNSDSMASPSGPLKITPSASSVRLAVQANTYYAANAIDGKRTTAWIEGSDGPGIGEWIRFDFDREINLHRIFIQPGYFKSPSVWAQNNRLAIVNVEYSDGSSKDLYLSDRMESQRLDVGSVKTRWVKLTIKTVYYGTDPDTALSEIAFEWE